MRIYIKYIESVQPVIQDIPNNKILCKTQEYLNVESITLIKKKIELLINVLKQALDEFGHSPFIYIKSNSGEIIEIEF